MCWLQKINNPHPQLRILKGLSALETLQGCFNHVSQALAPALIRLSTFKPSLGKDEIEFARETKKKRKRRGGGEDVWRGRMGGALSDSPGKPGPSLREEA